MRTPSLRAENVQLKAAELADAVTGSAACGIPYDTPCFSHQSEDMAIPASAPITREAQ